MSRTTWASLARVTPLALLSAVLLALAGRGDVTDATYSPVTPIVGIDAITTGNTATSVGAIDRCVSVSPSATFYVDLFVKNVADLRGFEAQISFNDSLLQVTSRDVQYLLAATPGSSVFDFSDPTSPPSGSRYLFSASDSLHFPETGSGVLGRLGITALGAGTSNLYATLWWPYGFSGVQLTDDDMNEIGDPDPAPDGDGYFDGLVFNAMVVVGAPCPADADKDGFSNVEESIDGSDLLVAGSTPERCDGLDNDGDGLTDEGYDRAPVNDIPDCVDPASNSDGDNPPIYNPTDTDDDNDSHGQTQDPGAAAATCPAGPLPLWADCVEAYLATDSLAKCPLSIYHSAWPPDINNDGSISVTGDVLQYAGLIGLGSGDDKFRKRLDLNSDGRISVTGDVLKFSGHIGDTCS